MSIKIVIVTLQLIVANIFIIGIVFSNISSNGAQMSNNL